MEIKQYIAILKRRAWLLIIGLVVFSIASYIASQYLTPVYQATTKLLVSRPPDSKTSEFTYLSDQQLAQTYIQLLTTEPVLTAVGSQLDYKIEPEQIGGQLIRDTLIIRITVDDNDPVRAANIANGLVQVLIEQNEIIQSSRFSASEQSLQTQLKQVENQIASLQQDIAAESEESLKHQQDEVQKQITALQNEVLQKQQEITAIGGSNDPASLSPEQHLALQEKKLTLEQLQSTLKFYQQISLNLISSGNTVAGTGTDTSRLDQMRNTLALYQQIYSNLLGSYESVRLARLSTTPNIVPVEVAGIPEKPIRPRPLVNAVLGGLIGLLLVLGIVFLIEYLDDTVKSPEDIKALMNVPVMAFVGDMGNRRKNNDKPEIYVTVQPRSPVAEAFRTMRTNIEFSGLDKPIKTLAITSPSPGEGKTTISVNLSATIAQSGKRTMLVDADLRRPKVHRFLAVPNRIGLSDILVSQRPIQTALRSWRNTLLSVIPSGVLPPNPSELLASKRMRDFIEEAKQMADIVIVDSPPILVSDTSILASIADAVIIVINPGQTQRDAAWATYEQLKRVNANVIGVVFNRIPKHRSDYYGNYRYYSDYYYGTKSKSEEEEVEKPPTNSPKSSRTGTTHIKNAQPASIKQYPAPIDPGESTQPIKRVAASSPE
ncbi:MAG: polysaccharide biosynthesis tyrosine autokinase [Anaerolineaceae bacterium]|nr:polysaccharide biosynthesis tyrosine autokinase [Anaerolineaceae bacterium]